MGPYCLIEHDNLVMYSGPLRTRTAFPLPSLSNRSTDSSAHRSVTRAVAVVGQLLESYGRERKGERTNERTQRTNSTNARNLLWAERVTLRSRARRGEMSAPNFSARPRRRHRRRTRSLRSFFLSLDGWWYWYKGTVVGTAAPGGGGGGGDRVSSSNPVASPCPPFDPPPPPRPSPPKVVANKRDRLSSHARARERKGEKTEEREEAEKGEGVSCFREPHCTS